EARARSQATPLVQAALAHQATRTMQQHLALLADDTLSRVADSVGRVAAGDLQDRAAVITDLDREVIGHERIALPWLREPVQIGQPDLPDVDNFTTLPFWNFPSVTFCIPPNPVLQSLRLHAALNLHKIRTCRNIAGMQRELDLYAAPTDTVSGLPFAVDGRIALPGAGNLRPTMYRYSVLVERAKQIAQLAAQVEASMLSALEKRDAEGYTWLKAQQDLRLSASNVRLNDLRVTEAQAGVDLAQIQRERAQLQEDTYQSWIEAGLNQFENEMIDAYQQGAMARTLAAFFDAGVAMGQAAASAGMTGGGGAMIVAVMAQARYMAQAEAIQQEVRTQVAAVYASFERRKQEWQLQRALAQVDGRLAEQQIRLAEDHVRVVEQERSIAQMQADNARAAVDYLANKFTTVDLYDWMSRTLEQVYAFFLRQATSVARLAETQLAFERQEPVRGDIQDDYWTAPPEGLSSPAQAPDRKGLTGSARLLQDLYQLDQYAFDTAQRKLQITKTISLARLAPAEFQRFRETGLLPFATPMEMFDRDFPGHFMRLIRRVRTSVIALIPPTDGIHATLSAGGISRVVVGPQVFQTVTIRRDPETIALSSPVNASGLFELEPAPAEMYLPFEGHGVETTWEFRLPRPANQFDYHTIADVLVTIDYTALNSFDYRQQVIRQLKPSLQADRAFSFRTDFADAWYDLHNPELLQPDKQMVVSVRVERNDFPPNLDTIRIEQVLLAFARAGGLTEEIPVAHFTLTQAGGQLPVGGSAVTANGAISTRRGNAGSWAGMIGRPPFGVWELSLRTGDPNQDRRIQRWFKEEQIDDVLLVISYAGRTPDWPS
ncbi:MAG TPA: hypothetical protein DEP84_25130, partial [Chloroflexi bacterium]|nr:hypothetical protein [Chloroflexota bacterium]